MKTIEFKIGETFCTYCGKLIELKSEALLETDTTRPAEGEFSHSACYFKHFDE